MYYKVVKGKVVPGLTIKKEHPNIINPQMLPEEQCNKLGYYRYEHPEFNPMTHQLGELIFDAKKQLVTHKTIKIEYDIQLLKETKIAAIKHRRNVLLSRSDNLALRKLKYGDEIPEEFLQQDMAIRNLAKTKLSCDEEELDFLLGRPLTKIVRSYGLRVEMDPDGVYHLVEDR